MHTNPDIAAILEGLNNPSLPGIDLSLVRMHALLKALGNPEKKISPVIHLAGTNGKGSTLAFLRAMLSAGGYRVHAYTSPHLVRFNERILLAGHEVSDDYLLDLLQRVRDAAASIPVTFFEATTAAAFLAFSEHGADVVLLETGLGGRLDATNVVEQPIASVVTPIDFDHTEFLGNSLTAIATEKAGILKRRAPCIVGEQKAEAREVLKRAARKADCPILLHGHDWRYEVKVEGIQVMSGRDAWMLPLPSLIGAHQYHNAALASVVLHQLPTYAPALPRMAAGVREASWPARLQRLHYGPLVDAWGTRGAVMLDGGHNPSAAEILSAWVSAQSVPVTLVVGMMQRKDAAGFLRPLAPHIAQCITVPIEGHDAYSAEELANIARDVGMQSVLPASSVATCMTLMHENMGIVLIAGSLFLAGEVLKKHS